VDVAQLMTVRQRLRMIAPRGKTALTREQLEEWWRPRICTTLQAETPGTIRVLEVEQKLDDIREGSTNFPRRFVCPFKRGPTT
jgi:hypothetical protein